MKDTSRNIEKRNKAESLVIALLLALTGGYLDIYCYLARGKVFANTQTGNLVLLGYSVAVGDYVKVCYYMLSIFSFMIGIGLAKIIEHQYKEQHAFYWLHLTLTLEMAGLFIVMFIPEGRGNVIANMIVSFICALQVQSFRKVKGQSYSTIMFTGNLKNIADQFAHYMITKDKKALQSGKLYLAVTITFVSGGWLGALITAEYAQKAAGMINIVLAIVFLILYFDKKNNNAP